jgi:perosamine synthetase
MNVKTTSTIDKPAIHGGQPVRRRPFAKTCFGGPEEKALLLECLESQQWSTFRAGSDGHDVREIGVLTSAAAAAYPSTELRWLGGRFVRRLEAQFAEYVGVEFAVSANSATSGLVMALAALGLGPGDEVLVPCMSFHATATAILAANAVPVFTEVKGGTFCMDPADVEAKITARSRALMVVHLGGNAADMDALMALAGRHGLAVIEDCAQAPGVRYKGRQVGSIGHMGVFSLTETKTITCGEGGVVTTNDPALALKLRLLRNHGEGVVEESWDDEELANLVGLNFRLTELQAAVAIAQLGKLEERNQVRRDNAAYLVQRLAGHPALRPPEVEPGTDAACYILKWRYRPAPGMPDRDAFVAAVEAEGVPLCAGYTRLLYQNPVFSRRNAVRPAACPRSEQINREFVWFAAVHPPNTRADMDDVVEAIDKVLSWPGF